MPFAQARGLPCVSKEPKVRSFQLQCLCRVHLHHVAGLLQNQILQRLAQVLWRVNGPRLRLSTRSVDANATVMQKDIGVGLHCGHYQFQATCSSCLATPKVRRRCRGEESKRASRERKSWTTTSAEALTDF